MRILAAVAGARSAEQLTFVHGDACASRYEQKSPVNKENRAAARIIEGADEK